MKLYFPYTLAHAKNKNRKKNGVTDVVFAWELPENGKSNLTNFAMSWPFGRLYFCWWQKLNVRTIVRLHTDLYTLNWTKSNEECSRYCWFLCFSKNRILLKTAFWLTKSINFDCATLYKYAKVTKSLIFKIKKGVTDFIFLVRVLGPIVYLITCSTCNAAYVGETGQKLRERLNGHRADIRNKADTPVGVHFGMSDHHLRVSGPEGTSSDTRSRRLRERAWIRFFQKSNVFTCMNRDNGLDILTLWLSFLQAAHPTHLSTHCYLEHPEALYLSPLFTTPMYICTIQSR